MLGVWPEAGGKHERMGTHNRLLRLGASIYLEVIAIDPAAGTLNRPRWFGLDSIAPDAPPRLATWVARTNDIDAAVARCGEALGRVEAMTRGALSWRITIPEEGSLVLDGVMPSLIEWTTPQQHPAIALPDRGCRLLKLAARHPAAERVRSALKALAFEGPLELTDSAPGEGASLSAIIDTPSAPRVLGPSPGAARA